MRPDKKSNLIQFYRLYEALAKICLTCLVVASTMVSVSTASAQTQMKQQIGGPFKPVENKKEKNGLAAMLVSVDDMPELVRQWYQTNHPPRIKASTRLKKGQNITSTVFFTGCQAGKNNNCDLSVQYGIKMGNLPLSKISKQVLYRSAPPKNGSLIMGSAMLNTIIEKNDPVGTWVVEATITDNVSNTTLTLTTRFEVVQ